MAGDSFPQFASLPPELQARIWEYALDDATATRRMIRVSVYHRLHVSQHSCITLGGEGASFCGQLERCVRYRPGERSHISMFMVDGFFSTSDDFHKPDDEVSEDGLRRLSLACQESRRVVTSRYPQLMRVHRGWFELDRMGEDSYYRQARFVRCDPKRDTLLVTQVPDMSTLHTADNASLEMRHTLLNGIFPRDAGRFAQFRRLLSSFESVAFAYVGDRRPEVPSDEDIQTGEYIGMDMPSTADFTTFLLFAESLSSLYAWPHPRFWHEFQDEEPLIIEDVGKLNTDDSPRSWEVQNMVSEMEDLIGDYARVVDVQEQHRGESDQYWVPNPKPLQRVGCFATRAWVGGSADTEGTEGHGAEGSRAGN